MFLDIHMYTGVYYTEYARSWFITMMMMRCFCNKMYSEYVLERLSAVNFGN